MIRDEIFVKYIDMFNIFWMWIIIFVNKRIKKQVIYVKLSKKIKRATAYCVIISYQVKITK